MPRTGGVSRLGTQFTGQEVYQGWTHRTQDKRFIKTGHTGHRTGGLSRLDTQDIVQEVYQGRSHRTQDRRCIKAGHTGIQT